MLAYGTSCLLHLALIAVVVLAQQWVLSAHASKPPVLPVELIKEEAPAQPPAPQARVADPPRPKQQPPLRPPKLLERPPQRVEAESEPPRPERIESVPEPVRLAPVPDPPPAPSPPQSAIAQATTSVPQSTQPPIGQLPSSEARPARGSSSEPSVAVVAPTAEGAPAARHLARAPSGPATAAAPSHDTAPTGGITQYARPQGGYQVRPGYPSTPRRLGIQGTTVLKVHVLVDGRVGDVVVQESAGHPDLDQAAADAVRRWRFEPGRRGEEPLAMWVLLPVEFRLK